MKNWLRDKYNQAILFLIAIVAIVYHDSFISPFFQDDKLLIGLAKNNSLFTLIPNFPFRPVSINWFYTLSRLVSGTSPLGYHLILFAFFAGTLFLIFNLAKDLLKDKNTALLATTLYALNVSIFANFYWIATSYFTIGTFFVFLTLFLYFQKSKWSTVGAFISFLLALGSYELSFVIPLLMILVSWYRKLFNKNLLVFVGSALILIVLRISIIGLPKAPDYAMQFNFQVISTIRWYTLRAVGLPEGVDRLRNNIYVGLLGLAALELCFCLLRYFQAKTINYHLFIFVLAWFLIGALPFYFLPNHLSSYYLGLALFGPVLAIAEVVSPNRSRVVIAFLYLILTIIGLDFLHHTHWIILKNTGPIGKFFNF